MRKKQMKLIIFSLITMLMLGGCGNSIPDMTEAQAQQIGEYAALTLLKYDANNRSRLVDPALIAAYDAKQKELEEAIAQGNYKPENEGMKPVEDTPVVETENAASGGGQTPAAISFEAFYDLPEGIGITYQGQEICDAYSGDASAEGFVLEAAKGKKLLVVKFAVTNQNSEKQKLDLFSKSAVYRVELNDSKTVNTLTTMLINDMSTYIGEIAAGENREMVLLVELDAGVAEGAMATALKLKNDSNAGTIQLQ